MTEDIVAYFNQKTGMNLTPVFDEYLRHAALPVLELKFDDAAGTVAYRWKADEAGFAMPIKVGAKDHWQIVQPTADWKTTKTPLKKDEFAVATDLYFVNVDKQQRPYGVAGTIRRLAGRCEKPALPWRFGAPGCRADHAIDKEAACTLQCKVLFTCSNGGSDDRHTNEAAERFASNRNVRRRPGFGVGPHSNIRRRA
jgi:hypothetical protein